MSLSIALSLSRLHAALRRESGEEKKREKKKKKLHFSRRDESLAHSAIPYHVGSVRSPPSPPGPLMHEGSSTTPRHRSTKASVRTPQQHPYSSRYGYDHRRKHISSLLSAKNQQERNSYVHLSIYLSACLCL